jgi:hypothetical protein
MDRLIPKEAEKKSPQNHQVIDRMAIHKLRQRSVILGTCVCLCLGPISPTVALGCEGGGEEALGGKLVFLQTGELKIPENATNTYTVEYQEKTENSGALTRMAKAPFTTPGGTCETTKNNLKNRETCTIEIHCPAGDAGKRVKDAAEVISARPKVLDAEADAECT